MRSSLARLRALAECDSAEDYADEVEHQEAEDEHAEGQAEYWADQDDSD